jgi:hypothetical protein
METVFQPDTSTSVRSKSSDSRTEAPNKSLAGLSSRHIHSKEFGENGGSHDCQKLSKFVDSSRNAASRGSTERSGAGNWHTLNLVDTSRRCSSGLIDCPPLAPAKYISRGVALPAKGGGGGNSDDELYGCPLGDGCPAVFTVVVSLTLFYLEKYFVGIHYWYWYRIRFCRMVPVSRNFLSSND